MPLDKLLFIGKKQVFLNLIADFAFVNTCLFLNLYIIGDLSIKKHKNNR